MSLAAKLDEIRAGVEHMIPVDKLAVMKQATADLRASGILDGVIKVGTALPPLELSNVRGEARSSRDLLKHGAILLTVFRGHW